MRLRERLYRFRSFWLFPLLAIALLYATSRSLTKPVTSELIWLVPLGILGWTLLEYGLHRFAFHIQVPLRNPRLREILNASHLEHHAAPRDPNKILVHPVFGLAVSSVLYALLYGIFGDAFRAAGVLTGIWTGFLYYEAVHYRVHFSLSASGFIAWQRRTHFYHHFTNNKRCFGVTSPMWDYVFGTRLPARHGRP
jgi:sterol desaturase/sphingolipid hydroxylase (fatty acid hydroxylase superfamily)